MFTDEEVNKDIAMWKSVVDEAGGQVIGATSVDLPNIECKSFECSLGNVIADSMVYNVSFEWHLEITPTVG